MRNFLALSAQKLMWQQVFLCALHLHVVSSRSFIVEWGSYTTLQVFSDASLGLTTDGGALNFTSVSPPLPPSSFQTSSGTGPWGGFEEVSFQRSSGEVSYVVRYHALVDAFTFSHSPNASAFPNTLAASFDSVPLTQEPPYLSDVRGAVGRAQA